MPGQLNQTVSVVTLYLNLPSQCRHIESQCTQWKRVCIMLLVVNADDFELLLVGLLSILSKLVHHGLIFFLQYILNVSISYMYTTYEIIIYSETLRQ
ncbi:hypothetical protein CHS0354_043028 [Potamilus streckersoni]|uniref:Uncharacterized protein n=1 Tax=Potamilus streckersoni TaxID=2493646 RepID=A0AAE0VTH9_9BIVA|nr:hypothetical protein CHS0354_043028 [Potamilus streckersoni]